MKNPGLFILLSFCYILFSCKKDGCNCTDIKLGEMRFNDSNKVWIPFRQGNEQVTFIRSSDGAEARYVARGYEERERNYFKVIETDCGPPYCSEYYKIKQRHLVFEEQANTNNLRIIGYVLDKYLPGEMPDMLDTDTVHDMLTLLVDGLIWDLPIDGDSLRKDSHTQIEFSDTLFWHGHAYHNVYHSRKTPDPQIPSVAMGIYYTLQEGIIGFYYPSGEEWYLKR